MDVGPMLAQERVDAVDAALDKAGHGVPKLRTKNPQPNASRDALNYRGRRMVEIVAAGASASTPNCAIIPPGWSKDHRGPCAAADEALFTAALPIAVKLVKDAHDTLKVGDATAETAVKDRFGDKSHLPKVKSNLAKWQTHLNTVVKAHHDCTDTCHGQCEGTAAYTDGDANKTTVLCDWFLRTGPGAKTPDERALLLVHEAGHGALDTQDVAYDTTRLLNVLQKTPSLALINTDSYVLLIQCLNKIGGCSLPAPKDTFTGGMSGAEPDAAAEALAWLERWMDWVWQDVNNMYGALARSRADGKWSPGDARYESVLTLLSGTFGLRRPEGSVPGTFREQTAVAAIHDRYQRMMELTEKAVARNFQKDSAVGATARWIDSPPPPFVIVTPSFFALSRRTQVEFLVKLVVESMSDISFGAESAYIEFVKKDVKANWFNKP